MEIVIIGHSYVRDLERLRVFQICDKNLTLNLNYFYIAGATFQTFLDNFEILNKVFDRKPDIVVVYLGGNDIKINVHIQKVYEDSSRFYSLLRSNLPNSFIIASQIEPRYLTAVNYHFTPPADQFSRLANYYNKWLLKQKFKDRLLVIKGSHKLSETSLYKQDKVHLTNLGIKKLFNIIKDVLYDTILNKIKNV